MTLLTASAASLQFDDTKCRKRLHARTRTVVYLPLALPTPACVLCRVVLTSCSSAVGVRETWRSCSFYEAYVSRHDVSAISRHSNETFHWSRAAAPGHVTCKEASGYLH